MSTPNHAKTLAAVLGRIVFTVALWSGILLGIRATFGVLIPAQWCGGTPIDPVGYAMACVVAMVPATQHDDPGLRPTLRQATVMATGLIVAVLAARLIVGCTPLATWLEDGRFAVEMLIMLVILVPVRHFHSAVIDPRWARATGELNGTGDKGDAR